MAKSILFKPVKSPYLVGFDDGFDLARAGTRAVDDPGKGKNKEVLADQVERLDKLQKRLYAHNQYSVLLVFQALDAAGKDGTIRAILTGVNPVGCQVFSYKAPNANELDHDFMWRCYRNLPERGRIGVWNRSHYEEVIAVRVHPEFLEGQKLPQLPKDLDDVWAQRFESINNFEQHWARNGCVVLKFFLHVSQQEQHARFRDRIEEPENHWKFNAGDLDESERWDDYMTAYQAALRATSKPWAPWYAIPADAKPYMRRTVAEIVVDTLSQLDLDPPALSKKALAELEEARRILGAR
jgi:PPK2 family polyphosphate:nucleotide phosphotransferase